MKTSKKLILVFSLVFCLCATTAFAATPTQQADFLHKLGVFEGTDKGFELDKTMTRAEAAAMVTRLLGAEEKAKAAKITMPFTDVPEWAAPYVNYLYEQKLTRGTSSTEYSPNAPITIEQYAVFMARVINGAEANSPSYWANDVLTDLNGWNTLDDTTVKLLLSNTYQHQCSRGIAVQLSVKAMMQWTQSDGWLAENLIAKGAFTLPDLVLASQGIYSQKFIYDDMLNVDNLKIHGLDELSSELFVSAGDLYAYGDDLPVLVAEIKETTGRWVAVARTDSTLIAISKQQSTASPFLTRKSS